jgi:choline transport protein
MLGGLLELGTTAVNVCLILTITELASAYPTAGGQYVWSAILSKLSSSGRRYPLSFVVGWATVYEDPVQLAFLHLSLPYSR